MLLLQKLFLRFKQKWEELKKDNEFMTGYAKWKDDYNGEDKKLIQSEDDWQLKYFIHKFNLKYQFKRIQPVMKEILFRITDNKDIYNKYPNDKIEMVKKMDDKQIAEVIKNKDKLEEIAKFWSENVSTITLLELIFSHIEVNDFNKCMDEVKKTVDEWDTFYGNTFKGIHDDESMIKCIMNIIKYINKSTMEEINADPDKFKKTDKDDKTNKSAKFTITTPLFDDLQFPINIKNLITSYILCNDFKIGNSITLDSLVVNISPRWEEFIIPKKYSIKSIEYYDNLASMLVSNAGLADSFFTYAGYLKYATTLFIIIDTLTDAISHSTSKSLVIISQ